LEKRAELQEEKGSNFGREMMVPSMARYRIVRAVACTSAALLCAAVAVSLNKGSMPSSLLSQGEAAAVLEHVLQTHDEAAAHHAGAVLEAVVDSMEL